jgi:hypothetical protein
MRQEIEIEEAIERLRVAVRTKDFQSKVLDGFIDGGKERSLEDLLRHAAHLIEQYTDLLWKVDLLELERELAHVQALGRTMRG